MKVGRVNETATAWRIPFQRIARDFTRLEMAAPVQFRQLRAFFYVIPSSRGRPFALWIRALKCAG
jgi:hypothetical protein